MVMNSNEDRLNKKLEDVCMELNELLERRGYVSEYDIAQITSKHLGWPSNPDLIDMKRGIVKM